MEKFLEVVTNVNSAVNSFIWGPVMIVVLLGTGIFLSIRSKFLQVRKFPLVLKTTLGKAFKGHAHQSATKSGIPQFEAFSTAIAGTVGTGNIVGVATALVAGGPGAIFWMWLSAFFGMMTHFSENILGIYYRKKNKDGIMVGGPMYYIENGLGKKWKWLAVTFAVFTIFASFGLNMTQANSISSVFHETFKIPTWVTGIVVMILIGLVTIGGIKRIGKVASYIVPFMTLIFLSVGLVIIGINFKNIPHSIELIMTSAFTFKAAGGGIGGYTIMTALRSGLSRGIFSNEAGLGSSVMANSSSDVKEPVEQGLWGVFEVFLDTIVICTLMGLIYLTTGAFGQEVDGKLLDGVPLALYAFNVNLGTFGRVVFSIVLPLFAFTTILGWSFYGEKAVEYLFGKTGIIIYKIIYLGAVVLGSTISLTLVWNIADTFNGLMAIPNLISLLLLSGNIYAITENYLKRHHKTKKYNVVPMLSYDDVQNQLLINELNEEKKVDKVVKIE